jgi:hypothetical protein
MKLPTDSEIRNGLLDRCDTYCLLTGCSLSLLGRRAVNDPASIFRIRDGSNFTISTYGRLMAYLDKHWPK